MEKIKKHKKLIIIGSLIIVIAIIITSVSLSAGKKSSKPINGYTKLSKTELVNSISVSGNIKSTESQKVYSTINYPVKEIHVSVGDTVAAGDILAELDTASLKLDIAQQRSTVESSQKTAAIDLENKRRIYENAKSQYEAGQNSELINAESNLKTAEIDFETKQATYDNNKLLFESGAISKQELTQSERSYVLAENTYNKAVVSLKVIKTKIEQDIKTAEASLKNAEISYNNNSQRIALQKLEKNLADSSIKSPIGGTVTAVYAVVGSPGNGLLFVIEDTESLVITTYVKEYDAGQVYPGQMVTIKSDATGAAILSGKVIKISPTSTKNATGVTNTSSTVEFETEVAIVDHNPSLKIGMNTRLNIILEKKTNVYAVPYDAVTVNDKGQSIIFAISDENGKKVVKDIVVETGMETDIYTEISGGDLSDDIIVVNDAEKVKAGEIVDIQAEGL